MKINLQIIINIIHLVKYEGRTVRSSILKLHLTTHFWFWFVLGWRTDIGPLLSPGITDLRTVTAQCWTN